jgi:ABC-type bacteriocin/lantibiotic exporter with double-glycine peptidase domain
MLPVVQQTFQQVIRLRFNAATVQRLTDLLAEDAPAATTPVNEPTPLEDGVSLVMRDVWFGHAPSGPDDPVDAQVLQGASLMARCGQFIAIVGASGVGKSSALWLLAGLASPDRGEILLGRAQPGAQRPLRRVLVPQDVSVWETTLLANVALGESNPDLTRAQEAARVAVLDEVVARLPEGWQTQLAGDQGRLSGGERQRLALARAIYVNPDVLLLDEVTSALDPDTERKVLSRIRAWQGQRTVVMVTHRQAVVAQADGVLSLQSGRFHAWAEDATDGMQVLP